jgi:hypothetical protein
VTVAPHGLLLSHFTTWLRAKNGEVDVRLLESLLDLRATYDDLEPTLWPAGSVQDLLLRLVPAKGPTEPLPSHPHRGTLGVPRVAGAAGR